VFKFVPWFKIIVREIALMMEEASTSETSVNFYQSTRRNNPQDSHLHFLFALLWESKSGYHTMP
jgi:hypothetical protein